MKTKKLVKHGNSLALVIDKPILDLLGIDVETDLEIQTDGATLTIQPALAPDFVRSFRKVLSKYDRTFADLAAYDRMKGTK